MSGAIVGASRNATRQRIPGARPKLTFAGIEVTIVFAQGAGQPEGHRALIGILSREVGKSLAVARGALFPLYRLVFPLINSGGKPRLDVPYEIRHGLEVPMGSFFPGEGWKLLAFCVPAILR